MNRLSILIISSIPLLALGADKQSVCPWLHVTTGAESRVHHAVAYHPGTPHKLNNITQRSIAVLVASTVEHPRLQEQAQQILAQIRALRPHAGKPKKDQYARMRDTIAEIDGRPERIAVFVTDEYYIMGPEAHFALYARTFPEGKGINESLAQALYGKMSLSQSETMFEKEESNMLAEVVTGKWQALAPDELAFEVDLAELHRSAVGTACTIL
jgi:hypothetical protein